MKITAEFESFPDMMAFSRTMMLWERALKHAASSSDLDTALVFTASKLGIIEAIKLHRERTHSSAIEAKAYIETLLKKEGVM